jgi:hypothetical protein
MHDVDEPTQVPDRKDSLATIRAAIHGKAARRREAADVNELVSDFGFLLVFWQASYIYADNILPTVQLMPPLGILNRVPQT